MDRYEVMKFKSNSPTRKPEEPDIYRLYTLPISVKTDPITKSKPFLKWAGGKRALIPEIKKEIPNEYNRYFEPFLGGGALFFSHLPLSACLSDINSELIICYQQVKENPQDVIELLRSMEYEKEQYYTIRASTPSDPIEQAARLIYLNHCCWNGLWRVNSQGQFNVPFGKYNKPYKYLKEDIILNASVALNSANAELIHGDFSTITEMINENDFVYFDPPYTVKHSNNSFISYDETRFSWNDQVRLADLAQKLRIDGVHIIISNADIQEIRELYKGFNIRPVKRMSLISGLSKGRGRVNELIISTRDNGYKS